MQRLAFLIIASAWTIIQFPCSSVADSKATRPNVLMILADDKYGQGIVNREFLSENKVFYHQSVESALAAI